VAVPCSFLEKRRKTATYYQRGRIRRGVANCAVPLNKMENPHIGPMWETTKRREEGEEEPILRCQGEKQVVPVTGNDAKLEKKSGEVHRSEEEGNLLHR